MTRFSVGQNETASERARREAREHEQLAAFPDVEYTWTATSRVARIKGTGIQIWQVIRALRDLNGDEEQLQAAFDMLIRAEIQVALDFYAAYPAEIDERIATDDQWTKERAAALHEELTKYRA